MPEELAHESRIGQAEIYHEKQKKKNEKKLKKKKNEKDPNVIDSWYEEQGNKIVKKTKLKSGNVHSVFVGNKGEIVVEIRK